jgi:uncharacterized membrane protein
MKSRAAQGTHFPHPALVPLRIGAFVVPLAADVTHAPMLFGRTKS